MARMAPTREVEMKTTDASVEPATGSAPPKSTDWTRLFSERQSLLACSRFSWSPVSNSHRRSRFWAPAGQIGYAAPRRPTRSRGFAATTVMKGRDGRTDSAGGATTT